MGSETIAAAAQGGSATILERLFRSERSRLIRYARRTVGPPEEASDIVHEAFARLARIEPERLTGRPEAYLQRILRNLLRDRFRRNDDSGSGRFVALNDEMLPPVLPSQEQRIEAADVMASYRSALSELGARTRTVFLLHRVDELPYAAIAMRLGISVKTVEYHMTRALSHLDKALRGG